MTESNGVLGGEMKAGSAGKGALLGFLGIGLACLGCCLAPILGTLAFAGLGSSILALFSTHGTLVALIAGAIGLATVWMWKGRSKACCTSPGGAGCSSSGCDITANAPDGDKSKP